MRTTRNRRNGHGEIEALIGAFMFAAVTLCGIGSLSILWAMFQNPRVDIIAVSNGAFVIVSALAALAFTYAQALTEDSRAKARVMVAGELLLLACLALLVSAIFRHCIVNGGFDCLPYTDAQDKDRFLSGVGAMAGLIFAVGIVFAHSGGFFLALATWERRTRDNKQE